MVYEDKILWMFYKVYGEFKSNFRVEVDLDDECVNVFKNGDLQSMSVSFNELIVDCLYLMGNPNET